MSTGVAVREECVAGPVAPAVKKSGVRGDEHSLDSMPGDSGSDELLALRSGRAASDSAISETKRSPAERGDDGPSVVGVFSDRSSGESCGVHGSDSREEPRVVMFESRRFLGA